MKPVSREKYQKAVQGYMSDLFVICCIIGAIIVISSALYFTEHISSAIFGAFLAIIVIILAFVQVHQLNDYKNNYQPREVQK